MKELKKLFLQAQKLNKLKKIPKNNSFIQRKPSITEKLKIGVRAMNELIDLYQPFILGIAKEYLTEESDLNKIIKAGNIGLKKAILKYRLSESGNFFSAQISNDFKLYAQFFIHHSICKKIGPKDQDKEALKN